MPCSTERNQAVRRGYSTQSWRKTKQQQPSDIKTNWTRRQEDLTLTGKEVTHREDIFKLTRRDARSVMTMLSNVISKNCQTLSYKSKRQCHFH